MKKIGLLIEISDGLLKPANLSMITAAHADNHHLTAISLEPMSSEMLELLSRYGVDQIITVQMEDSSKHAAFWAQAVQELMTAHDIQTLFGLTTPLGKDLLPRIAAVLDAPLVMDCVHVDVEQRMARTSQYSGKTMATFRLYGENVIYGLRPNAITPVERPSSPTQLAYTAQTQDLTGLTPLETLPGEPGAQNLSEAEVIISGGRGLKNGQNFDLLFKCATAMGEAAVGASRVAVDEGWVPYTMQVGQTGSKVNPKVYIACGISGSVQHLAGMKTAGLVIAINTDPDAAIISHCDYYVIADLFEILPALTRQLSISDN